MFHVNFYIIGQQVNAAINAVEVNVAVSCEKYLFASDAQPAIASKSSDGIRSDGQIGIMSAEQTFDSQFLHVQQGQSFGNFEILIVCREYVTSRGGILDEKLVNVGERYFSVIYFNFIYVRIVVRILHRYNNWSFVALNFKRNILEAFKWSVAVEDVVQVCSSVKFDYVILGYDFYTLHTLSNTKYAYHYD